MIKKINKLVGLKKADFDEYVNNSKISLSEARLIPILKPGDEMALTSVLMSSIRLIKEFRYQIFKDIKLKRSGKAYFYTEVCFKDIDKDSRLDGLILIVVSGVIQDAVFIEVKSGKNLIKSEQIMKYYKLARSLNNVPKILTVSNEFVADSSQSPISISNQSKKISLYHFSWTYIKTLAQLLLFDNDDNIDDEDQIEIMNEVMHYLNDERSGVSGFHKMSAGWKEVAEKVKGQQSLSDDNVLADAITSWYQEERDMTLMLSRKLGVLVKSDIENPKNKLKRDIKKLKNEHYLSTKLRVRGAVSDIKVSADFERRTISMSVDVTPPLNKGVIARVTWIKNQLEKIDNQAFLEHLYVDADIKYTSNSIKYKYANIDKFYEHDDIKNKDIISFNLDVIKSAKFTSVSSFVKEIESMLLDYYKIIVQDLKTWEKPAPKLQTKKEVKTVEKSVVEDE
tara:strand:+ start:1879 stop:3234 length:1356 start_codon:yes stop_codon:yes gene_type:complete